VAHRRHRCRRGNSGRLTSADLADPIAGRSIESSPVQNQSDEENLVRGRDAARRRSWEEAFDSFVDAQANGEVFLAADLETWSVASFLLGRLDTALEAMTAAHRAHVDAGRSLDAVRCGFWMSHMLAGRGDIAQAGDGSPAVGGSSERLNPTVGRTTIAICSI